MIDERELLAIKLKEFRKQHNLNQFEFAEDCGVSKDIVSLIERCKDNVTLDTVQLFAARMGLTVSELFIRSDVTYFVIPGTVEIEGETYTTYGIGAIQNGIMQKSIPDISTSFNKIKNLVLDCNDNGLSLIHLEDVIEDFLP